MTRARAAAVDSRPRGLRASREPSRLEAGASFACRAVGGWADFSGPIATVLLFACVAAFLVHHLSRERERALEAASREVGWRAGELAHRLDQSIAARPLADPTEALRTILADDANWGGGQILLADETGAIVAGVPVRPAGNLRLVEWLGPASPLTLTTNKAEPTRFYSREGEETVAAVIDLTAIPGRLALTAPVNRMLSPWRESARLMIALLAASGLALSGSLGVCWRDAIRRRTRADLEAVKRAHVDLALNRGRCGLWNWDLASDEVSWSRSMFEMLGLPFRSAKLPLAELESLVHPEDKSLAAIAAHARQARIGSIDVELRMRGRDGQWIWLRKRAEIVDEGSGGGLRLVGIVIDVSDRKREADAAATADQRLREAIEAISEAFVLWDSENRLVLCNSKYQRLHNLTADFARSGAAYADPAVAGSAPIVSSQILDNPRDPALGAARAKTYEAQLADGRWLQVNERRTRDGGFVSVGADITALKPVRG